MRLHPALLYANSEAQNRGVNPKLAVTILREMRVCRNIHLPGWFHDLKVSYTITPEPKLIFFQQDTGLGRLLVNIADVHHELPFCQELIQSYSKYRWRYTLAECIDFWSPQVIPPPRKPLPPIFDNVRAMSCHHCQIQLLT